MSSSFTATLLRRTLLTHDVGEFVFRPHRPEGLHFSAGQYVDLVLQEKTDHDPGVIRAYSICSPPAEAMALTIVANLVPEGRGTPLLFGLPVGAAVRLQGPRGHFVVDARGRRDYLFVATGTGIAPLYSMIHHLLAIGMQRPMTLYWGLRSQCDLFYQTALEQLAQAHANFGCVTTLSRPEPGWTGASGRVTTLIAQRIQQVAELDVYVCGSQTMIHDVKTVLRTKGLCPVHTEQFY